MIERMVRYFQQRLSVEWVAIWLVYSALFLFACHVCVGFAGGF